MEIKFQILCLKNELIQIPCYNCSIEQELTRQLSSQKPKQLNWKIKDYFHEYLTA